MKSAFKRFGLTGHDITFIKVGIRNIFIKIKFCRHQECIWGEPLPSETELVGRGENKKFMYQLVNNKKNGIDVDKVDNVGKSHNFLFFFFYYYLYHPFIQFDYLIRDDTTLGLGIVKFDPDTLVLFL